MCLQSLLLIHGQAMCTYLIYVCAICMIAQNIRTACIPLCIYACTIDQKFFVVNIFLSVPYDNENKKRKLFFSSTNNTTLPVCRSDQNKQCENLIDEYF